jgi:uncharacterized C2H2 Zn-finger protein
MCEAYTPCPRCGTEVFHNREQVQVEKTSLQREVEFEARTEHKNPNDFIGKMLVCPKCGYVFPINRE